MEERLANRQKRLEILNSYSRYANDTEKRLDSLLVSFGWNKESTITKFCKEIDVTSDCESETRIGKFSLKLSKSKIRNIIETAVYKQNNELLSKKSEFPNLMIPNNTEQAKLAVYNYAIEKTGHLTEPEFSFRVNDADNSGSRQTFAQIVDRQRKLKRRKAKQKTDKSGLVSHTELIRQLIEIQMDALGQYRDEWSKSQKIFKRK